MQFEWLTPILIGEIIFFILTNCLWIFLYFNFRNRRKYIKTRKKPLVSILIPSYNKAHVLEKTIRSVLDLDYPKKDIIVIDDGSTDRTKKLCERFLKEKKIRLITHGKNLGKATALNDGIKMAKGEIVLTVDADSFPERDSLKKLVPYFADPKMGAVAGVIKIQNSSKFLTMFQRLEYLQMAFQRLVQGFFSSVLVTPGPLTAYRKSALEAAGYFDSSTLVEDWDITMKIHKAGYKIIAERDAVGYTMAPSSFQGLHKQRLRWNRGGIQIAKRHCDIFFNKNNRTLGLFVFPLHLIWLSIPFILLPTAVIAILPESMALENILLYLSQFMSAIVGAIASMNFFEIFKMAETMVLNFLDFLHLDLLRIIGFMSIFAFLAFIGFSMKTTFEKIIPRDIGALLFLSFYWLMLLAIFIHAFILEVLRRERKW